MPARNLREAEHARCERCREYWRLGGLANMRAGMAKRLLSPPPPATAAPTSLTVEVKSGPAKRADGDADAGAGQVGLEDMLEAAAKYAEAAKAAIEASRLSPKRGEAMRWAQWAEAWTRRAFDTMKRLRSPLLQYARHERFVRAVDGGGGAVLATDVEVRAPLRLVVPGDPLPVAERSELALAAERWAAIREKLHFRRSVQVPAHWPEERRKMDRWLFHFALSERRRKPLDVWIREWSHLANLTEHRVAPAHATGAEARAWAVAFAREVGFTPLELTSPGKVVTLNLGQGVLPLAR